MPGKRYRPDAKVEFFLIVRAVFVGFRCYICVTNRKLT